MKLNFQIFVFFCLAWFASLVAAQPERKPLHFLFDYGATVEQVPIGSQVKIWFPIPNSDPFQKVTIINQKTPVKVLESVDSKYKNRIGHLEFTNDSENISFEMVYDVTRREAKPGMAKIELPQPDRENYLQPNRLVPTTGKPAELIADRKLPNTDFEVGAELYEVVEAYMTYDKSKSGYGNGDVVWACSSKTGNCTDFHSLFIALARNQKIPARFEIGFPIPEDKKSGIINGYHCWAWFHTQEYGWIAVDISEADKNPEMKQYYFGRLTPNRVAFSIGRDIELAPTANSKPLNYFIYPHVEIDGNVWPKTKIKLDFKFKINK